MNFLNYPSPPFLRQYYATAPFLHQRVFHHPQNSLKIPPFPTISMAQSLNIKRPSTYNKEDSANFKGTPTKKIKMDSLNMLLKPSFAERDPYQTSNTSRESFNFKESNNSAVSYTKLNDQLLAENHITINLSTKTAKVQHVKPASTIDPSRKAFNEFELNTKDVEVRSPGASLYNMICQKLEENCHTLINQMQGLLAMSQDLKREVPKMSYNLEDTQPGTPNTIISEAWYETKSHTETLKSKEDHEQINEQSDFKDNSPVSRGLKASQRVQVKMKKPVPKANKSKGISLQNAMFIEKKEESGRKMNRLQMLRAEKEELERQWASSDDNNMNQKIVLTRVGENYQAEISMLEMCETGTRTRRVLKLRKNPEMDGDEQNEGESLEKKSNCDMNVLF